MKTYLFILLIFFLLFTKVSYGILPDREYRFFPEKLGLIYKDLNVITTDNIKIKTWFFPAQDSLNSAELEEAWNKSIKKLYKLKDSLRRPTIIICNGDAGNMSWQQLHFAANYVSNGYNVVTFDWRGFGESTDWQMNKDYLVYTELLIDYDAVINEVINQKEVDTNRIALMGWSTGAYLSMAAASKRKEVSCFIGQALMTSFDDVLPLVQALPKNKDRKLVIPQDYPKELFPINLASKFNKSTFLIVGEIDERTPVWMSKKIFDLLPYNKELWIVNGAEHGGPNGPQKDFNIFNEKIVQFLNKYLKK